MLSKEQIQKEIEEMNEWIPVSKIEEKLGMPTTTLQKVLKGTRPLPKKWHQKLEAYFMVHSKTVPEKEVENEITDFKKLWKPTKKSKQKNEDYDGFVGKSFTQQAYNSGLTVQVGDDIIRKDNKPIRENFKNGFDYSIALSEWKEQQSK